MLDDSSSTTVFISPDVKSVFGRKLPTSLRWLFPLSNIFQWIWWSSSLFCLVVCSLPSSILNMYCRDEAGPLLLGLGLSTCFAEKADWDWWTVSSFCVVVCSFGINRNWGKWRRTHTLGSGSWNLLCWHPGSGKTNCVIILLDVLLFLCLLASTGSGKMKQESDSWGMRMQHDSWKMYLFVSFYLFLSLDQHNSSICQVSVRNKVTDLFTLIVHIVEHVLMDLVIFIIAVTIYCCTEVILNV